MVENETLPSEMFGNFKSICLLSFLAAPCKLMGKISN